MGLSRAWVVALILLPALLGCLGDDPADPSSDTRSQDAELELQARGPLTDGAIGREPALISTSEDVRFVAAWSGQQPIGPLVWRSPDGGASWERLQAGDPSEGAAGNSDVDLAIGPDGTIYHTQLTFAPVFDPTGTVQPPVFGSGGSIVVGSTADGGETWSWTVAAQGPLVDRPWIEVDPDGIAHLVWNDARGVHHATSTDGGDSFQEGPLVHPEGGDGGFDIGPEGELAIRVVPPHAHGYLVAEEADGVAVSTNGGESWRFEQLPGDRAWSSTINGTDGGDGIPRLWDPIAVGSDGAIYTAWSEGDVLVGGRSTDLARSWTTATLAEHPEEMLFFPFLDPGHDPGTLAATWFSYDRNETLSAWVAHVGWTDRLPDVSSARMAHGTNGTWGEYLEVEHAPDGSIWAVVPIDQGQGPVLHQFEVPGEPAEG